MPCKNHPLVEDGLSYCSRCGQRFCRDCVVEIGGFVYCASCKQEAVGDLRAGLPAVGLELASVGRRFAALFIDSLLLSVPLMVLLFAALFSFGVLSPKAGQQPNPVAILAIEGVFWLAMLAGWILYEGLMLRSGGQTLGKKALGIKVVSPGGAEISAGQAFGRAALRQLLGLVPCLGLVNYLVAFGQERTCIHDMGARTRVINWTS
jgi:uncharacterized RDD family membrane protein YckC